MSLHPVYLSGNADYDDTTGQVTFYGVPRMPSDYSDPINWYSDPASQVDVKITVAATDITVVPRPVQ